MIKHTLNINKPSLRFLASAFATCLVLAAWSGGAQASETANCSIFEIKASNGKPGMDAELKPIEKKLKKPPFSAWKTFTIQKKHSVKAELMKPLSVALSAGGKLGLLFKERSDGKGRKSRLRMVLTLDDAKGKRKAEITLKFDSGDFSLVGQDSSRILALRCSVK